MSDSDPSADSTRRWRLAPDAGLRMHCWDGECVIWHGAAGDTHRMLQAIGQLLDRLQQSAASASELSLAVDLHKDDIDAGLAALAQLGMVESLP